MTPRHNVVSAGGWLRLVGSLKLYVSFAKEPYQRYYILQKETYDFKEHTTCRHPIVREEAPMNLLVKTMSCLFLNVHTCICMYVWIHRFTCIYVYMHLCYTLQHNATHCNNALLTTASTALLLFLQYLYVGICMYVYIDLHVYVYTCASLQYTLALCNILQHT